MVIFLCDMSGIPLQSSVVSRLTRHRNHDFRNGRENERMWFVKPTPLLLFRWMIIGLVCNYKAYSLDIPTISCMCVSMSNLRGMESGKCPVMEKNIILLFQLGWKVIMTNNWRLWSYFTTDVFLLGGSIRLWLVLHQLD